MIGKADQAKHQYDLGDFYDALAQGNLPAVSFVKAKKFQDAHAGFSYSNPIDEQTHLVSIDQRRREISLLEGHGDHHRL